MKLTLFMKSLSGGGAQRSLVNLARGLTERGHAVDLLVVRARGPLRREVPTAVRVIELPTSALAGLPSILRDLPRGHRLLAPYLQLDPPLVFRSIPALVAYLRNERPEALLAVSSYANLAALWAGHLAGTDTRLVISERNTISVRARREKRRRYRLLPGLMRHYYPWADAVTTVSEGVADDLAEVTGIARKQIHATYNPVLTPELDGLVAEPVDHPWLQGTELVVLGAGRLHVQKDFSTLLDAFALLRYRRPCKLIILGEGPERGRLVEQAERLGIAEDVSMPGFVANPFAWMARASVFALSSAWEGLPGVLIQAMACGCPVVSTDCPSGASEVLEGGACGPLVPVGDANALADALFHSLAKGPDLERLRKRAESFSLARVVDRHLEILQG